MKKDIALFTIAHNEYRFLPIWEKYYSKYINIHDMYIMNHDSDDGSIEQSKCNIVNISHPNKYIFDHNWFNRQINNMQHELLEKYKLVIYADTDEILVINGDSDKHLDSYIEGILLNNDINMVAVTGYNLIQGEDENDFDFTKTVFEQRKYWCRDSYYDKHLILKNRINWTVDIVDAFFKPANDPQVCMLHIHRLCKKYLVEKHLKNLPKIYPHDPPEWGNQHKIKTEERILNDFFYVHPPLVEIPENIITKYKGIL